MNFLEYKKSKVLSVKFIQVKLSFLDSIKNHIEVNWEIHKINVEETGERIANGHGT